MAVCHVITMQAIDGLCSHVAGTEHYNGHYHGETPREPYHRFHRFNAFRKATPAVSRATELLSSLVFATYSTIFQ
jgi:hypothetical protein